ncbi:MAG TPA: hypothetical protein ENI88_09640, partial [Desulfobulbus sp.]|nr:hypothetical protein [Desulfobulbus sp.]
MNELGRAADKLARRGVVPSRKRGEKILQALLDMGYTLNRPGPEISPDDEEYSVVCARLKEADSWSLQRLRRFF